MALRRLRVAPGGFASANVGAILFTAALAAAEQPSTAAPTAPVSSPQTPDAGAAPAPAPPAPPTPVAGVPSSGVASASPPADAWGPPSFGSDPLGAAAGAMDLTLKMYGDTGFSVRSGTDQPWPVASANANAYSSHVWNSFSAPRLDLFGAADAQKLSFLTEVMFEAVNNQISLDVERLQVSYLFSNWLRLRAGRTHVAWGYYNDTYHHGNFFELTTSRPFSINFEDSFGVVLSHNVGVGLDGTFDLGGAGSLRYDAEVGNGRAADITSVALQYSEKNEKVVNIRLRWMPVDGLILGVNGMRDVVPLLPTPDATVDGRPETEELVGGAHVVYTEHHCLADVEAFAMRHNPNGAPSTNIYGWFAEIGYTVGVVTPYGRAEYMRFPARGDLIYQYSAASAQGMLSGHESIYYGSEDFTDLRVGVKWLAMAQLAFKLEGERLSRNAADQEIATVKAAFGF
jgi:hypothetical protein